MTTNAQSDDIRAIKSINASQLDSITWSADTPSDWNQFAQDFLPSASLYAAARSAQAQTVAAFAERMNKLSQSDLRSATVHVFGDVAIAFGVCKNIENGSKKIPDYLLE